MVDGVEIVPGVPAAVVVVVVAPEAVGRISRLGLRSPGRSCVYIKVFFPLLRGFGGFLSFKGPFFNFWRVLVSGGCYLMDDELLTYCLISS